MHNQGQFNFIKKFKNFYFFFSKGDYSTTTKSMLFLPTDEWQYRDNWPEEGFGAQEGPCHFRDIIQLPDSINCDSMHSTFIGSFKECFEWLYSEALKEFKKNADL